MPRYNQLGRTRYNSLGTVRYNVLYDRIDSPLFQRLPNARPVVLDDAGRRLSVLDTAYDITLSQEVNGEDVLTFALPFKDVKRADLINERRLQLVQDIYVVRKLEDARDDQGRPITQVYAEALWYDLQYADPLSVYEWSNTTPEVPLAGILTGTGWTVGTVEITTTRNLSVDQNLTNRLRALRHVQEVWGGELRFDTANRTVSLLSGSGQAPGIAITYRKNAKSIKKIEQTDDLITRLYPYGKNGLTIADVNGGKPYLENYQYMTKIRVRAIKDERFTNAIHLMEWAAQALDQVSRPRVSYMVQAADLSALSGFEHEAFTLGDVVMVYDEELGINVQTRIVKWQYQVAEPWRTTLELSAVQPGLSELMDQLANTGETLQGVDQVSRDDMVQLMVFNYLLNSRADDGFAYWVNSGWEIDNTLGFSGGNSFKCVGQAGAAKTLSQTIWPSHRENYTISFRAGVDSLVKGANGRVGVEVVINYTDGTSETVFLPLA